MVQNNGMIKLIDMGSVKVIDKEKHLSIPVTKSLKTESDIWRNNAVSMDDYTFVGTEG